MISTTTATQKLFQKDFDEFGDSFVEDTTPERIKDILTEINLGPCDHLNSTEIAELEEKYFPDESPYGLFRMCNIYLDNKLVVSDPTTVIRDSTLDLLALELRFFGATISETLNEDVSHVMVDKSDLSRLSGLKQKRRDRRRKFHIVTEAWIRACMEEGSTVNERAFEPVVQT